MQATWQFAKAHPLKFETQYPYESFDDEFWNAAYLCYISQIFRIYAGAVLRAVRSAAPVLFLNRRLVVMMLWLNDNTSDQPNRNLEKKS